eukprot:37812-Ditylum_brightwellii.AAC.1
MGGFFGGGNGQGVGVTSRGEMPMLLPCFVIRRLWIDMNLCSSDDICVPGVISSGSAVITAGLGAWTGGHF